MAGPLVKIDTPLGDAVRFLSLVETAELGRISRCDLTLVSIRPDIHMSDILGKQVSVMLQVPNAAPRLFQGYVTGWKQAGMRGRFHVYQASVRPWIWLLTRRSNCRIFQNKTVEEIVKTIFADPVYTGLEFGEIKWKVNARAHPKREYCVQYRESDFNFVSRLLEDEGIYYWFQDKDGKESLILTDNLSVHDSVSTCESLPYGAIAAAAPNAEYVSEWEIHHAIVTRNWLLNDYDFKHPSRRLEKQAVKSTPGFDAFGELESFDYPGGYIEPEHGESRATTRADEHHADAWLSDDSPVHWNQVEACTNSRSVRVGTLLKLTRHPRADQNTSYLIIRTRYEIDSADYEGFEGAQQNRCECRFTAINAHQSFAPARVARKPFMQGPQTAVVVGPSGDEIYTDNYGRVKVQFFWDRQGKRDENSSCWIRVSQPWAGKGWGGVSIPRMGQEVIVDFLEGDPDRPIITGRVYNGEQSPPFALPAGAVVSGLKSRTHKGSGFNELSMNDTAGQEQITIHGQHDMKTTVRHDQTTTVLNNRTDQVQVDDSHTVGSNHTVQVGKEQKVQIGTDRTETVGGKENITITGHRTETVNSGETVTINGGRTHTVSGVQTTTVTLAEVHSVGAGRMHNVGAGETVTVGGVRMVSVGGAQIVSVGALHKVSVGSLQSISVAGAHKLSAAAISETAKGAMKIKAGGTCVVEAQEICLKAGGSKIVLNSSGVTVSGAKIAIKADGKGSFNAGGAITIKGSNLGED